MAIKISTLKKMGCFMRGNRKGDFFIAVMYVRYKFLKVFGN